tara:strand:+ start:422 stop:559 length:138 start_codon:yes stop_codon:yes gene_type:complete
MKTLKSKSFIEYLKEHRCSIYLFILAVELGVIMVIEVLEYFRFGW